MNIYSWNVNGIRAVIRKGELQTFITRHHPDVLCLQETKAEQHQVELDLPGYRQYWNAAERKGYSGTAVFSRREPLNVIHDLPGDIGREYRLTDDGYGDLTKEGRVIAIEYDTFYLVTVYTPNAKNDLSRLELLRDGAQP